MIEDGTSDSKQNMARYEPLARYIRWSIVETLVEQLYDEARLFIARASRIPAPVYLLHSPRLS